MVCEPLMQSRPLAFRNLVDSPLVDHGPRRVGAIDKSTAMRQISLRRALLAVKTRRLTVIPARTDQSMGHHAGVHRQAPRDALDDLRRVGRRRKVREASMREGNQRYRIVDRSYGREQ